MSIISFILFLVVVCSMAYIVGSSISALIRKHRKFKENQKKFLSMVNEGEYVASLPDERDIL